MLGGAKVSDKLGVIGALLDKCETILIGGAMAFTFLAAQGYPVGDSLLEPEWIDECKELLDDRSGEGSRRRRDRAGHLRGRADAHRRRVAGSPTVGRASTSGPSPRRSSRTRSPAPRTCSGTGRWACSSSSRSRPARCAVAEAVADCRGFTVIGGGDSAAAIRQFGLADRVDHVSTGGGASLELIEQGDLPGLAALRNGKKA